MNWDSLQDLIFKNKLHLIKKFDVSTFKSDTDQNALHVAASLGYLQIVEHLIKKYPKMALDICSQNSIPLHYAIFHGHKQVIQLLATSFPTTITDSSNRVCAPVIFAVFTGNLCALKTIASCQPSALELEAYPYGTLLHVAVEHAHNLNILRYLLDQCPYEMLFLCNIRGERPLHYAVRQGNFEAVKLFYKANPTMVFYPKTSSPHQTPFLDSVLYGNLNIASYFLKMQPKVIDFCNGNGEHALHVARNLEMAKLLLSKKPNFIDALSNDGNNVLHFAVFRDDWQLVRFYLELKPKLLFDKNQNNQTPLQVASLHHSEHSMIYILNCMPDIVDVDCKGNTPLHLAVLVYEDNTVLQRVLQHNPCNLHKLNNNQLSPFDLALESWSAIDILPIFEPFMTVDLIIPKNLAILKDNESDIADFCVGFLAKVQNTSAVALNDFLLPELLNLVQDYIFFRN